MNQRDATFADKTEVILRYVFSNELGFAALLAAVLVTTWLVAAI